MASLQSAALEFVFGWCHACGRDVLTHADYDNSNVEQRRCVHCDGALENGVRLGKGQELAKLGYELLENQACGGPDCEGGTCTPH